SHHRTFVRQRLCALPATLLVAVSTAACIMPVSAVGPGRDNTSPTSPQRAINPVKLSTGVVPAEAVWDWSALEGGYDVLDKAADAATQQVTWTLRLKPRVTVN